MPLIPELVDGLRALTRRGGDANRLVLAEGEAFLVVEGAPGSAVLRVLAAGSANLKVTADQVHALRARGFTRVQGRPNLGRLLSEPDLEALAEELLATLSQVYGADEPASELRLGEAERIDDQEVVTAMRTLARERDMPARKRVYTALLSADLLVPMDDDVPAVVGELSGWEVAAAFTAFEQLLAWDPRAPTVRRLPGYRLFPLLAGRARLGSLLVNPRGTVGGELYRNEVLALARATRG